MAEIILHMLDPFHFSVSQFPSAEYLKLLESTTWGTSEVLYKIKNVNEIYSNSPVQADYLTILNKEKVLAGMVQYTKNFEGILNGLKASYISSVAVDRNYQRQGIGKELLGQSIHFGLGKKNLDFFYAYIEKGNKSSVKIFTHHGFRPIRSFSVWAYLPQKQNYISKHTFVIENGVHLNSALLNETINSNSVFYANRDYQESVDPEKYFVLRRADTGEIIAGTQIKKTVYEIVKLGGIGGFVGTQLIKHHPSLQKKFSLEHFSFLQLGNSFIKAGYEVDFPYLLDYVLKLFSKNIGIFFIDEHSELFKQMKSVQTFGLLGKLIRSEADIWFRNIRLDSENINNLKHNPWLISLVDN